MWLCGSAVAPHRAAAVAWWRGSAPGDARVEILPAVVQNRTADHTNRYSSSERKIVYEKSVTSHESDVEMTRMTLI